ncbi:ROK family protein [Bifidobacterium dolichotidis]|uniref:ROK family protein n=1 Tax=Bifidobacterium dolichotidis TaxID=2306976 RepID=A0A430FTJ6_9BIFI|nr:ROK family protein [Bifidobacterium dolichotidis]RSX56190.1 ROK family protein [Bifidobacterium dolichotidis]
MISKPTEQHVTQGLGTSETLSVTVATPEDIRKRNRRAVLHLLYPHQQMSRADVAKITGLSKSSASSVVSSLIDDGLVIEEGIRSSSGRGKPAIMLKLNPDARQIITVDISQPSVLSGAITNLTGQLVQRVDIPIDVEDKLEVQPIADLCMALKDQLTAPLLGIGVASPGTVDADGVVLKAPNIGWENVALAQQLEELTNTPVLVNNNANVSALAERQYGESSANMIFVRIARGVGAAMLIDDKIIVGSHYSAGEIGHVSVDERGPMCTCGKRGCLETMTSIPSLHRQLDADPSRRDRILTQAGTLLGQTLAMPAAMAGISDIVISGEPDVIDNVFLASVDYAVNSTVDSDFLGKINVRHSYMQQDIALLGESVAVLRAMLV